MDLSGHYFIDGIDLWNFKIFVASGSEDFLRYPAKKDSITHDWPDQNGIDVDLFKNFLKEREITLQCAIVTTTEAEFWDNYYGFLKLMTKPGRRRIEITEFSNQQFFVYYKDCAVFERFTRIKQTNLVACKFSLLLVENEPSVQNGKVFLIDEQGRFIVT